MWDATYLGDGHHLVGLDEVGRGPLAGPVVSAAVCLHGDKQGQKKLLQKLGQLGITDSKKLTSRKRLKILGDLDIKLEDLCHAKVYTLERAEATLSFSLSEVDHHKIDEINILQASLLSMELAAKNILSHYSLEEGEGTYLVDGVHLPQCFEKTGVSVIKGDQKSLLIGLASVIAKEYRDHLMKKFDLSYPGYGLASHAGYPTPSHKAAIAEIGPSPIHRRSFRGVREHVTQL